jgi:hypothetical protein
MRPIHLSLAAVLLAAAPAAAQDDLLRLREDATGELSADDPTLPGGSRYDVWRFAVTGGTGYVVYLLTDEFDGALAVGTQVLPRCDGCVHATRGSDPVLTQVEITPESDGMLVVRVSSARPGQTGRYIVAVHDETTFTPASELFPDEATYIEAGQEVTAELVDAERQETTGDGRAGDLWRYSGRAGETLVITLRSDDFDPFLQVLACGSRESDIAFDDDGGGGTDSRIEITLRQDCEYEFRVGALLRSESGTYTLRVESRLPPAGGNAAPGDYDAVALPVSADSVAQAPTHWRRGTAATGELHPTDRQAVRDSAYFDLFSFRGSEGETFVIRMTSGAFNTELRVLHRVDGAWTELADDDDGGKGTDSELTLTLPADGEYLVMAKALRPGETGPYTLTLDRR